jgi:DNA-binding MarR family transcriptional regulator
VDILSGAASPMSPLRPDDYEALAELRYLGRKFLRFSKDLLREEAGLNPEQYEALLAIKAFPARSLTISQLSERLQIKHHSAVHIVDRLVERKLVRRQPGEHDRRERHVGLTDKGEKLIEELASVHYSELSARSAEMIKAMQRLKR